MEENIQNLANKLQDIDEKLTRSEKLTEELKEIEKRIDGIDALMGEFKEYQENKRIMKNSDEPWADFMTEVTNDGRVKVKFDWNKAMITELRRLGFNAQSEEDLISAYFSQLIGEHGETMSKEEYEGILNA